uniref:Methyltransferase FkbM domain-containing protein n=1 Tax=Aureoumbra lagunensis TaxID=44058 RepID=A0A7S3NHY6_9STRA
MFHKGTSIILLLVISAMGILDFPAETDRIIINIGPNLNPALPHRPNTEVLALEPMVGCRITGLRNPHVHIIHAAVGANSSLAQMNWYHVNAESSSFSHPTVRANWNNNPKTNRGKKIVPVIGMSDIFKAIPPELEVWYLKTDMQGFDFQAIVSGGEYIKRAHYILTETWFGNVQSYSNVQNDFCKHLFPYMISMNFIPIKGEDGYKTNDMLNRPGVKLINGKSIDEIKTLCNEQALLPERTGSLEGDVFWKRVDTTLEEPVWREAKENP